MSMRWQNLPFDKMEEYKKEDLRTLSMFPKAVATIRGHPLRVLKNYIEIPEYFGWFVNVVPNGDVVLIFRKNKKDVELEIDDTMLVQILTIGLE